MQLVDTLPAMFYFFLYVRKVLLGLKVIIEKEVAEKQASTDYPATIQSMSDALVDKLCVMPETYLYSRRSIIQMSILLQIVSPKNVCRICYDGPFQNTRALRQHERDQHDITTF